MALTALHPSVRAWFAEALGAPTRVQERALPAIGAGADTLVAAPTGAGKTLAAFLSAIDGMVREGGSLPDEARVLYVSPLRALSNDIRQNLELPLAGIAARLPAEERRELRVLVRTGDTRASERARMRTRAPHIVVTTPESLYILLTSESGRAILRTVRTVIVDEIHAVASGRRGAHLALSLERLDALAGRRVQRIGLSATQSPLDAVARLLVGRGADGGPLPCAVIDEGHRRPGDLAIEVPAAPLEAVLSHDGWSRVHDRIAELAALHRTTLVFTGTRRLAERLTAALGERLGVDQVATHHGSLSRESRERAERRLKSGELRLLVATASLELGIDIGSVDLVCQIGSPRSFSAFLQRAGRSGHRAGERSRARVFPLSRDDLVECAALLDGIRAGELDRLRIPPGGLDVLAQQIVATVATGEWAEDALFDRLRRAEPYAALERARFDAVVALLSEGFATRRGKTHARVHRDGTTGTLRPRRGTRLVAVTSGGAIPDTADYEVRLEPEGTRVGTLHEDFAIESSAGDVFQLGNSSWKILRVESSIVRVEDARGAPPTVPFWLGEAPSRTAELSARVSALRARVEAWLEAEAGDIEGVARRAASELSLAPPVARELTEYLAAGRATLGAMPTAENLVLERFFDDSGGMQLVVHSPRGAAVNRALGLALRKRFCQRFDFELQAAATDDAVVLSLGHTHSFPLDEVFGYLRAATVRGVLVQAVLAQPLFTTRFRWNASRSLATLRFRGGRRVPPRLQRMDADDLLAAVFPDQVACAENLTGPREVPDHPLVEQTLEDCLHEAMDLDGLVSLLCGLEAGAILAVARDTTEPSLLAREILGAKPWAFLDDAPLEERRTRAVSARRWLDPVAAGELGALDAAAIAQVREEASPVAESPDELHEALTLLGAVTPEELQARGLERLADALLAAGRAARVETADGGSVLVAADAAPRVGAALRGEPRAGLAPPDELLVGVVRGRMEVQGPATTAEVAATLAISPGRARGALEALEREGTVLRGRFSPGAAEPEWCERRLLARIHRMTLGRLRQEIEPVSTATYLRYLVHHQRASPATRVRGPAGLAAVLELLEGFEAPAPSWERDLLPTRVDGYAAEALDALCLTGRYTWGRRGAASAPRAARVAPASLPITFLRRATAAAFRDTDGCPPVRLSGAAERLRGVLEARGASFFPELVDGARLLRAEAERALAELVEEGLVTADAFAGLRALLTPARLRSGPAMRRRSDPMALALGAAGRWALVPRAPAPSDEVERAAAAEVVARTLLGRYGVFLRRVVDREAHGVGSVELLRVLRRLEARGEIRGGRFVAGQSGEQYALPGVVESLRALRRSEPPGERVVVSAADPLNLSGVLVPGERIAAVGGHRILLRDGLPVAVRAARGVALTPLGADLRPADVERELLRPARDVARVAS